MSGNHHSSHSPGGRLFKHHWVFWHYPWPGVRPGNLSCGNGLPLPSKSLSSPIHTVGGGERSQGPLRSLGPLTCTQATPLARPMLAMSSHGQELERLDVNGCPRILGPVARVMTSQTLLPMGLCPYYRFKAVRREEVLREWGSLPFPGPSSFVPDDPAPVVGPNCWLRERQQPLGTRSWEICSSQVP